MPDYYKTHSITVKNRLGFDTVFELEQWLSSAPSTVKKLPITKDTAPKIIVSSDNGRGVFNYRVSLSILNEYNDNFRTIFNSYSTNRPRLKIKIEFSDSVFTQVFLGILDYEYLGNSQFDVDPIISVDFATGFAMLSDKIFDSTQITEDITGSALIDRRIIVDHILSKIFFQEICTFGDEVVYAFGNNEDETRIWFEHWRVAQYGTDEEGITYPSCVFIDLLIDIQELYESETTYKGVIFDICKMFDITIGYSQFYEKPVVHFFTEGKSGNDYRLVISSGAINHKEERTISSLNHEIKEISSSSIMLKPKPIPKGYEPLNSIYITRPGPTDFDGINGNNIPVVNENLEENSTEKEYTEKRYTYNYRSHTYPAGGSPFAGIFIKDEKESIDFTSITEPARIMKEDGIDFYYEDITEFLSNIYKDHRFVLREGLRVNVMDWLDPMFPFIHTETGKVHRIIKSRQDPINIVNDVETIEIGEVV